MAKIELEQLWQSIPVGAANALDYTALCSLWGVDRRTARHLLHDLSKYDNGDDFVLIRSGKNKGFYLSDDAAEIGAYRRECLSKGKSIMAAVTKCNRVLRVDAQQTSIENNLRNVRTAKGFSQAETIKALIEHGITGVDAPLLSKIENGVVIPTNATISALAQIYGVNANYLYKVELY